MRSLLRLSYLTSLLCCGGLLLGCGSDDCPHVATGWPKGAATTPTRVSLAAVCGSDGCPVDKESAILRVRQQVQTMGDACGSGVEVVSGCGVDSVEANWGTHGSAFYYEQKSGNLIGADVFDDVAYSLDGCSNLEFHAGDVPPSCKHVTKQSLCAGSNGSASDAGTVDAGTASRGDASAETDAGN